MVLTSSQCFAQENKERYLDSLYDVAFNLTGVDIKKAQQEANIYMHEAKRLGDTLNMAYAYDVKGLASFYGDLLDSAFWYANRSVQFFRDYTVDSFGLSTAIYNRSLYHDYLGAYKSALQDLHLSREIDLNRKAKKESDIFYFHSLSGIVYNQGNYELALRYQHKAWQALSEYGSWYDYMKSDMNLSYAWTYFELGIYELAELHARRAYKEGLKKSINTVKSAAILALSEIALAQSKYDLAVNYARQALKYDQQYGDDFSVIYTESALAKALHFAGNKKEASNLFNKVRARFMKYPNPAMHIEVGKKLFEYYKLVGNDKLALKYLEIVNIEQNKVNQVDGQASMRQFDQELQKRKQELSKAKSQLQEEELNLKNTLLAASIILIVSLIGFSILVYLGGSKIAKNNKELAARNQEIKEQSKVISKTSEELKEQNIALEKLNQSKDRLFSILTHDLRQPFNQILSVIDLMDQDVLDVEEKHKLVNHLRDSVNSTSDLVSNVLLWSKAQFAGVTINPSNISLSNAVKRSLLHFSLDFDKKKIKLEFDIPEHFGIIFDPDHFASVFRNVLSNAYKFTPENSSISIWAEDNEEMIDLFVKDQGMGMDQEQVDRLMSARNVKSIPGTLNESGTGIGMIIVNDFLKENSASFSIQSKLEEGTTFILHLPKGNKINLKKTSNITDPEGLTYQ